MTDTRASNTPSSSTPGTPDLQSKPRLAPGCRLSDPGKEPRTLLMPERALRLQGPSLEIIERCDGQHTVEQIIADLQKIYSKAHPDKVAQDILGYLTLLHEQGALEFTAEDAAAQK